MSTLTTLNNQLKFISGQDSLSDTDALRLFNFAKEDYSHIALTSSGRWKFDATNHLDDDLDATYPRATATLGAGEESIPLETNQIMINQVNVTVNGKKHVLAPIDVRDSKNEALSARYATNGEPKYYDYDAQGLFIYPKSDTARTIEVLYSRAVADYEALSEDSGIIPGHEEYLVYKAAQKLGIKLSSQDYNRIENELIKWEGQNNSGGKLREWFSKRDQDTPRRLKGMTPSVFMGSARPRRGR